MRKRVLSSLALCMLVVGLCGCSQRSGGGKAGDYQIYYSALPNQNAPLAVGCETWTPETGEQIIPGLLEALLAGPTDPELASPFPDGTRLLGWKLGEGCLRLDLSEQYGDLTGIDLTVADCCLSLTLCQAEGVESVYVTVEGSEIPYRPIQKLTEADILTAVYEAGT